MRRWWGGLRVAGRIARRDARRAKGRTALVAVMVGLPVLAGSAGAVLIQSQNPTDATYASWVLGEQAQAHVSANLGDGVIQDVLGRSFSGTGSGSAEISPADYELSLAGALPAGDQLLRVLQGTARLSTPERAVPATTDVLALPSDGDLSSVFPTQTGVLPTRADQVALNEKTVERLGVGVGDAVTVEPSDGDARQVTVSGILAPTAQGPRVVVGPGGLAAPPSVSAGRPWEGQVVTSVEWYVVGPEPVTWEHVLAVNGLGSAVTSRAVVADPPPREAVPFWTQGGGTSASAETVALGAAIAAMVMLEAALLIGPAFAVGARRHQRQLALLAAAGAERRTLRHVILLTGVVTGLGASVAATVLGLLVAVAIRAVVHARGAVYVMPDLRIPWLLLLGFGAVGTLAAAMAAWFPARRASRVDVVAALAGRRADARPRRRVAVLGVVLAAAGAAGAVAGAATGRTVVLVASVMALEIGVVAASGALVSVVARLAPRFGVIGRIALRDAARNRTRTAPAVAAVIAAVAGITAGAVYYQSSQEYQAGLYAPVAAVGTVTVHFPLAHTGADAAELVDAAEAVLRADLPVTDVYPVHLAVPPVPPVVDDEPTGQAWTWLTATLPPDQLCPLWSVAAPTSAEYRAAATDPRCEMEGRGGAMIWMSNQTGSTVLVDDGTVVAALGFEESVRAAQAVADGLVVVGSERAIWPDGTAHLELTQSDARGQEAVVLAQVALPAVAIPLPNSAYDPLLPPGALEDLGLTSEVAGLIGQVSRPATPAEEATATAGLGGDAVLWIEHGNPWDQPSPIMLVLVIAALAVGLAATGISVVLSAVESRPDLATLAAIGAEPRARRRFAAAQAGVISVLGGTLGVAAGLMLGWVLVTGERFRYDMPQLGWQVAVPWPTVAAIAVGIPLLAMAVGYLATRSRLPLVRRIAT